MRKLCRADELAAAGKTNEEIAAELEVSATTLYTWRLTRSGSQRCCERISLCLSPFELGRSQPRWLAVGAVAGRGDTTTSGRARRSARPTGPPLPGSIAPDARGEHA